MKSIKNGFSISRNNFKLLSILYLLNFVFSLVIILPIINLISFVFGHISYTNDFLEGFNFSLLTDFAKNYNNSIGIILFSAFLVSILYFILNIFLSGGILSIYSDENKKFQNKNFFGNCSTYFLKFFILFLINAIIFVILIILIGLIALSLGFLGGNEIRIIDYIVFILAWIFFGYLFMVYDFARMYWIKDITTTAFSSLKKAVNFTFKNFLSITGLMLFWIIFSFLFMFLLKYITDISKTSSWIYFVLIFLFQQILLIVKIYFRLSALYSEFDFLENKI